MSKFENIKNLLYGKNAIRYQIVPIVFLFFFTSLIQLLAIWGQGRSFCLNEALENLKGDCVSWTLVLSFYLWAWLWIRFSPKTYFGPETTFNYRPPYADNGLTYFNATMLIYLALQGIYPGTSRLLYDKFPQILGVSNNLALLLCVWLFIKGKWFREHKNDKAEPAPWPYEFYRGMEVHARTLGVDAKQFTNCRVGMMTWPIFTTAFSIVAWQENGFSLPIFVHFFLQMVYFIKFYWWETGYLNTPDMTLDRAGYYLCWGCLVFMPSYFCFPISYVVTSPPKMSDGLSLLILFAGLAATYVEYEVDHQKESFRASWKSFKIWGKPAKYILAEFKDSQGKIKKLPLLTSGYWGMARHFNYTMETIVSFTISASLGFNNGIWTFAYFIFIFPLLLHRILRDDAKCSAKYGKDWVKYKSEVKYIMVPGIF